MTRADDLFVLDDADRERPGPSIRTDPRCAACGAELDSAKWKPDPARTMSAAADGDPPLSVDTDLLLVDTSASAGSAPVVYFVVPSADPDFALPSAEPLPSNGCRLHLGCEFEFAGGLP